MAGYGEIRDGIRERKIGGVVDQDKHQSSNEKKKIKKKTGKGARFSNSRRITWNARGRRSSGWPSGA